MAEIEIGCEACEHAERNPNSGRYMAECPGCKARALSQSPVFFESVKAKQMTPAYGDALRKFFGDGWEQGHEAVKYWHRSLSRARAHLKEGGQ